jgi:hypothetical protein
LISYLTDSTRNGDSTHYSAPATALPKSETHGLGQLDAQGNVFGNVPPTPNGYVDRIALQKDLRECLLDDRHPIVTLVGRGGIGKTALALSVLHEVDSVEHGHGANKQDLEMMKAKGVYWVPTMGYFFYHVDSSKSPEAHKYMEEVLQRARQNIPIARELGVKIANGFDPSSAEEQGKNAQEIIAMSKRGLPPIEAIRAATANAADLMGWQDKVGSIQVGRMSLPSPATPSPTRLNSSASDSL